MLDINRIGDIVSVQFEQEEDVAIFVPASADVILCTQAEFQNLVFQPVSANVDSSVASSSSQIPIQARESHYAASTPRSELAEALKKVGAVWGASPAPRPLN